MKVTVLLPVWPKPIMPAFIVMCGSVECISTERRVLEKSTAYAVQIAVPESWCHPDFAPSTPIALGLLRPPASTSHFLIPTLQ
jgi:hypothetical protein